MIGDDSIAGRLVSRTLSRARRRSLWDRACCRGSPDRHARSRERRLGRYARPATARADMDPQRPPTPRSREGRRCPARQATRSGSRGTRPRVAWTPSKEDPANSGEPGRQGAVHVVSAPILGNVTPGRPCHPQTAHALGATLDRMDFSLTRRPSAWSSPSARRTCSTSTRAVRLLYILYGLGGRE